MVCTAERELERNKLISMFLVSTGLGILYYLMRTAFGVDTDLPGNFAGFITTLMIFAAVSIILLIWLSINILNCLAGPVIFDNIPKSGVPSIDGFVYQNVNVIYGGYIGTLGGIVAAVFSFLYSQFYYHVGTRIEGTVGFNPLPKSAYGGKRKKQRK